MPDPISLDQLTLHAPGHYVTEASDLGWRDFPNRVVIGPHTFDMVKVHKDREQDVTHVDYRTHDGVRLVVFND